MASTPSANNYYGRDPSNASGYYSHALVAVQIPSTALGTSGSPADLATVATGLSRYIVHSVYVESISAAGTLGTATVDIRTATAGGGSSILNAATALTGLTALNLVQAPAVAALSGVLTAANLTLRQTIDSLNAGNIAVVINLIPVP